MSDDCYSISQMAAEFKTTQRALRFYEEYELLSPKKVIGKRSYSKDDRIKIKLILEGKRLGFTVAETKTRIEAIVAAEGLSDSTRLSDRLSDLDRDRICSRLATLLGKRADILDALTILMEALRRLDIAER